MFVFHNIIFHIFEFLSIFLYTFISKEKSTKTYMKKSIYFAYLMGFLVGSSQRLVLTQEMQFLRPPLSVVRL